MSAHAHRTSLPGHLKLAILSMSSTRTFESDKSGLWIKKQAQKEGHEVVIHQVIPDDANAITDALGIKDMSMPASPRYRHQSQRCHHRGCPAPV